MLRTEPLSPWVPSEAEPALRQARKLKAALEKSRLGAPGEPPTAAGLAAAHGLLELGFPHALELTPEQLAALRESEGSLGPWFRLFAGLAVTPAVALGLGNGVWALELSRHLLEEGLAAYGFLCATATMAIGLSVGLQLLRLSGYGFDEQRAAAAKLGTWNHRALALIAFTLLVRALAYRGPGLGPDVGWLLNVWALLPVTLPLSLYAWLRLGLKPGAHWHQVLQRSAATSPATKTIAPA